MEDFCVPRFISMDQCCFVSFFFLCFYFIFILLWIYVFTFYCKYLISVYKNTEKEMLVPCVFCFHSQIECNIVCLFANSILCAGMCV